MAAKLGKKAALMAVVCTKQTVVGGLMDSRPDPTMEI